MPRNQYCIVSINGGPAQEIPLGGWIGHLAHGDNVRIDGGPDIFIQNAGTYQLLLDERGVPFPFLPTA
jgi:hypothetical protein